MKTKIVVITRNFDGMVCYIGRDDNGQPTNCVGNIDYAYHFTGSRLIDLTTPEDAAEYFMQEHNGNNNLTYKVCSAEIIGGKLYVDGKQHKG